MRELREGELAKVFDADRWAAHLLAVEARKPQEWEQVQLMCPDIFAYAGYVDRDGS